MIQISKIVTLPWIQQKLEKCEKKFNVILFTNTKYTKYTITLNFFQLHDVSMLISLILVFFNFK